MTEHQGPRLCFGPVPSRRLGRSLGINNIPPKHCSYACTYCQLGRTPHMSIERRVFYDPSRLLTEVQDRVQEVRTANEELDYLCFVPDGEPSLDLNLGKEIELLKPLGVDIGVISNASLIWMEEVREELAGADWVSLKVDAANESLWHEIDRPHGRLRLEEILEGILCFAESFGGHLVTETMLIRGLNDQEEELEEIAIYLEKVQPEIAYLSIPIRPPAESGVQAPDEAGITRAWSIFSEKVARVECLSGAEGDSFFSSGDVVSDLLSTTSVHPMRLSSVEALLKSAGASWSIVEELLDQGTLIRNDYGGETFFIRKLRSGK